MADRNRKVDINVQSNQDAVEHTADLIWDDVYTDQDDTQTEPANTVTVARDNGNAAEQLKKITEQRDNDREWLNLLMGDRAAQAALIESSTKRAELYSKNGRADDVAKAQAAINQANDTINGLDGEISALEMRINSANADIAALEMRIKSAQVGIIAPKGKSLAFLDDVIARMPQWFTTTVVNPVMADDGATIIHAETTIAEYRPAELWERVARVIAPLGDVESARELVEIIHDHWSNSTARNAVVSTWTSYVRSDRILAEHTAMLSAQGHQGADNVRDSVLIPAVTARLAELESATQRYSSTIADSVRHSAQGKRVAAFLTGDETARAVMARLHSMLRETFDHGMARVTFDASLPSGITVSKVETVHELTGTARGRARTSSTPINPSSTNGRGEKSYILTDDAPDGSPLHRVGYGRKGSVISAASYYAACSAAFANGEKVTQRNVSHYTIGTESDNSPIAFSTYLDKSKVLGRGKWAIADDVSPSTNPDHAGMTGQVSSN